LFVGVSGGVDVPIPVLLLQYGVGSLDLSLPALPAKGVRQPQSNKKYMSHAQNTAEYSSVNRKAVQANSR
jgi:NH3-dependent NAD+ synthetase